MYWLMCWSRNKYHYAIRKLKKESDNILAKRFMEASENSDLDLLDEMKSVKTPKCLLSLNYYLVDDSLKCTDHYQKKCHKKLTNYFWGAFGVEPIVYD